MAAGGLIQEMFQKTDEVWYLAKAESKRHLICVTIRNGKPDYVAYEANGKVIDRHS